MKTFMEFMEDRRSLKRNLPISQEIEDRIISLLIQGSGKGKSAIGPKFIQQELEKDGHIIPYWKLSLEIGRIMGLLRKEFPYLNRPDSVKPTEGDDIVGNNNSNYYLKKQQEPIPYEPSKNPVLSLQHGTGGGTRVSKSSRIH